MASAAMPRADRPLGGLADLLLPGALVGSVLVVLVKVPAPILDVLLAANIAVAVIILLTTVYVRTPLEFSIFPSLLLAATLARLVLNVATTRLVLTQAQTKGMLAAGGVVKSFGEFVAGDKIVVGLIIFTIVFVIQFVVITKGATRISEVAARFALDGMPGRQMAIDADLNAGVIDQSEAQRRRGELVEHAEFFGAMDGASKFVRGDAIAGVVITLVNIVGGLVIGVVDYGMDISHAASLFTRLTIGDGLVSQIPAFLTSLAAGLLVTRSSAPVNLPGQFLSQLFSRVPAMAVTAGFLGLLIFTGLPALPLLGIGGGCVVVAVVLSRRNREAEQVQQQTAAEVPTSAPPRVEDYLAVEAMEVEIGVGLIRLADPKRGGDLLERIARVRQNVAMEMGLIVPKVRIRDNLRLDQNQYRIKLADVAVAEGKIYPGMLLAIDMGATTGTVGGLAAREPTHDAPATWIDPQLRDEAEGFGYTVVEPISVLASHLTEVVRLHADEILSRDATRHLIDELKKTSPTVVEDLIPGQMKLVEVQQILQLLLREQVSIRHLVSILETLGEHASRVKEPALLAEYVRHRLSRVISSRYRDKDGRLLVVTLDPALEDRIRAQIEYGEQGFSVRTPPAEAEFICGLISDEIEKLTAAGRPPIVLVAPQIRAGLKQLTALRLPRLVVLSYNEITRDTQVESVCSVSQRELAA
ncbi:MAG TPA: flagellar biosynthesis protein FlhA [Pirellulales bacterium]|nr:flagellar biosynthesis protein FlhA [Pirellulales bacterium]